MARKYYDKPLLILKGFNSLSDLLSIFPFDIVYKHMIVNNIRPGTMGTPTPPKMVELIYSILFTREMQEKHSNGDYAFETWAGFRLTTSNKQFELSYQIT